MGSPGSAPEGGALDLGGPEIEARGLRVGGPASRRVPEARSARGVLESRHPVGLHEDHVEVGPSEVGRPGKRRLGQGEGPVEDRSGDDPEG